MSAVCAGLCVMNAFVGEIAVRRVISLSDPCSVSVENMHTHSLLNQPSVWSYFTLGYIAHERRTSRDNLSRLIAIPVTQLLVSKYDSDLKAWIPVVKSSSSFLDASTLGTNGT